MALTGDQIEAVTRNVVALYREAEMAILREVTRQLAQGMDAPDWAVRRLAQVSTLRRAVERILAIVATSGAEQIRETLAEAYRSGQAIATVGLPAQLLPRDPDTVLAAAGQLARTPVIEALAAALVDDVGQRHSNVLRHVIDVYRSVIQQATAVSVAGGMTRRQASQHAYARLIDQGISSFTDSAGRTWRLSSYVEMGVRTVTQRAAVQGQTDRLQSMGLDLVIVSDSPRECPLCRPWEGKVLSISGSRRGRVEMPSMVGTGTVTVDIAGSTAEARAAGLQHPNCTHSFRAYLPGATRRPDRATSNEDGYEAKEKQRYIERQIRRWKEREIAALDEAGRATAKAKVRQWRATMRDHLKANPELKRLSYREQIGAGNLPRAAVTVRRADVGDGGLADQPALPRRQRRPPADQQQSAGPPEQRLAAATSTTEVERALIDGWKAITGQDLRADLTGGDLDSVREVAATLLRLASRYPEAQLRHVEIFDLDTREAARTEGAPGVGSAITLNRVFFAAGRRDTLLATLRRAVERGFLVPQASTVQGIITHEFGHVLDIQARPGWTEQLEAEILNYAAAQGVTEKAAVDTLIGRELSKYAASHILETVAEAFAEVVLAPPGRPLAQMIYRRLMDTLGLG